MESFEEMQGRLKSLLLNQQPDDYQQSNQQTTRGSAITATSATGTTAIPIEKRDADPAGKSSFVLCWFPNLGLMFMSSTPLCRLITASGLEAWRVQSFRLRLPI